MSAFKGRFSSIKKRTDEDEENGIPKFKITEMEPNSSSEKYKGIDYPFKTSVCSEKGLEKSFAVKGPKLLLDTCKRLRSIILIKGDN